MWKFKTASSTAVSPLQNVIANASSKANIRFVIYNLSQRHVEIATERGDCNAQFSLDASTISAIKNEATKQKEEAIRHGLRVPRGDDGFALLAFDIADKTVQLIQTAPEVAPINGILMAMVTELIMTSASAPKNPYERIPYDEPTPSYNRVKAQLGRNVDEEAREFAKREAAKRRNAAQVFPSVDDDDDDDTSFGVIDTSHKGIGLFG